MKKLFFLLFTLKIGFALAQTKQPVYQDKPFLQDYSIKYYTDGVLPEKACIDRNGNIKLFSSAGLLIPHNGQFLYAGTLIPDNTYRTIQNKNIKGVDSYENQFILLDDKTIFSNAWAGSLFAKHELPDAKLFVGGQNFTFLLSNGKALKLIDSKQILWKLNNFDDEIIDLKFQKSSNLFWILGTKSVSTFSPETKKIEVVFEGNNFTAFDFSADNKNLYVGTNDGYFLVDIATKKQLGDKQTKLPSTNITSIKNIGEKVWFGTTNGAFALKKDGKFDYYNGERWLTSNQIKYISEGPENSVLIVSDKGLSQICFKRMTLHDKAIFFEKQVRSRHIRNGFNASLDNMEKGNLSTGYLADSDNDGLWTSMYLGAEIFRYVVTKEADALQNCRESLDAMERLYSINPIEGFPARSFERSGFIKQLADPDRWQHSPDKEWDWKATTSSDEAIRHIFVYSAMAELLKDAELKKRSIALMDTLMGHIVRNDLYLIDYDGKPTAWGRWNPTYVNAFPTNVGDRKLNSLNIIAMLQTAYYFTKKPIYKEKAFELMKKHGYFENLMRPMKQIGYAPEDADEHSKKMSDAWNHSDDEMYFLGYWGLYRYALNDTLKAHYKKAIIDHWQAERPEKEGLWNIFTALTGTQNFDLNEATWYLREHPLDLIDWEITNSHRKDIEKISVNFRSQTVKEVLPPDERPIQRHNANMFNLDRTKGHGTSEHSAGDIWLLPYWLGRYLGVISSPQK